jgi:hypothetical protein
MAVPALFTSTSLVVYRDGSGDDCRSLTAFVPSITHPAGRHDCSLGVRRSARSHILRMASPIEWILCEE